MMVYGELGVVPLNVDIKLRMLTYWARLCLGDKHKILEGKQLKVLYSILPLYIFCVLLWNEYHLFVIIYIRWKKYI